MLSDLVVAAKKRGLELHPDKTKIMRNTSCRQITSLRVQGMELEVLPVEGATKYLGRKISFRKNTQVEVTHRIELAWKKFMMLKTELTDKSYPLKNSLRLFNATVTPTMLYGSAAWALTKDMESKIKRTQRRML